MYKYPELFLIIDDIKVDLYDMFTWVWLHKKGDIHLEWDLKIMEMQLQTRKHDLEIKAMPQTF